MSWNIRGRKAFIGSIPQTKAEMTSSGITPTQKPLQDQGMDGDLRSKLYNTVHEYYVTPLNTLEPPIREEEQCLFINPDTLFVNIDVLMAGLVNDFIKKPITAFYSGGCWDYTAVFNELGHTFSGGDWQEVYFLLTMFVKNYPNSAINKAFMDQCNKVLEEENSAYQFVAGRILPKMSDLERKGVEKAASGSDEPSKLLDKAVEKLAQGDTKNAIKEAVLAVESLSGRLSLHTHPADLKKTLPKALERLEKELRQSFNPNLKETFLRLYDYASSEPGIRHSSTARPTYAEEAEARFILVTCSALINYLRTKADEAGLKFD